MRSWLDGSVQVAGVHDLEEAASLLACGVDFVGLPLPDGHEDPLHVRRFVARARAACAKGASRHA